MAEEARPPLQNAACEIIPCANGFLVMNPRNISQCEPWFYRDVYVFESFEALTTWLEIRFPWRNKKVHKDG
jgi:hypothetical protein